MHTFAMLLKSFADDFDYARRLIASFRKFNADGVHLYCVVPAADLTRFAVLGGPDLTVLSESELGQYLVDRPVHGMRAGYINQEIIKLAFWELELTENYFCVDSDASWFPPLELPTSTNFEWQWASTVRLTPTAYDADWGATLVTRTRISKVQSRKRGRPAPICVEASVLPENQARQTACPGAPSLTDALADCALPRARCAIKVVLGSAPHQSSRLTTSEGRVRPCGR